MDPRFTKMLKDANLSQIEDLLNEMSAPAIGFELCRTAAESPPVSSKLGGNPDLPLGFDWPTNMERPLDFLMQVNLVDAHPFDAKRMLPLDGLLTFFYDLNDQPWGYDPNALDGFQVVYHSSTSDLRQHSLPNEKHRLAEHTLDFHFMETLPHYGSRAADRLLDRARLSVQEEEAYLGLPAQMEGLYFTQEESGNHRLLGHSANIQDDMQLEAQLVTNGLDCGNTSGYDDPRRPALESSADDWLLLLQLDSDPSAGLMWGDCGMLYWWIRREELAQQQFEHTWMTIQCH